MINQRTPHPSERQPWPGENMPLPTRVAGERVLAAIKLLPIVNQPLHQWILVIEVSGAMFAIERFSYRDGQYQREASAGLVGEYSAAVATMVRLASQLGTPRLVGAS